MICSRIGATSASAMPSAIETGMVRIAPDRIAGTQIFGEGRNRGRHDRNATGHGFENDEAETFLERGKYQRIRQPVEAGHVGICYRTGDMHRRGVPTEAGEARTELFLIVAMVQERGAPGNDELGIRPDGADLTKGFENTKGVLSRLDAADTKEDRPASQLQPVAQSDLLPAPGRREAVGVDAIADYHRINAAILSQLVPPEAADGEDDIGRVDRAILQSHQTRIGELVDVVDRAGKIRDQALQLEGCQRIAGNAVMGVEQVEAIGSGSSEITDIVGNPLLDHFRHVRGCRPHGNAGRAAGGLTKEARPLASGACRTTSWPSEVSASESCMA